MAQVALKREIEGYQDVVNQYQREARKYKSAADIHNAALDTYNTSWVKDSSGNVRVYTNADVTYKTKLPAGYAWVDLQTGRKGGPTTWAMRKLAEGVSAPANSTFSLKDIDTAKTATGKPYFAPKPGDFKMTPPTEPGPNPAEGYTTSQLKTLDEPSLTDIERNQPSGLISSSFNR